MQPARRTAVLGARPVSRAAFRPHLLTQVTQKHNLEVPPHTQPDLPRARATKPAGGASGQWRFTDSWGPWGSTRAGSVCCRGTAAGFPRLASQGRSLCWFCRAARHRSQRVLTHRPTLGLASRCLRLGRQPLGSALLHCPLPLGRARDLGPRQRCHYLRILGWRVHVCVCVRVCACVCACVCVLLLLLLLLLLMVAGPW